MTTFLLKISSPSNLSSKTNIHHPLQLSHKPFYFTPNPSKKPHNLAITNSYQNAPSASIAGQYASMTEIQCQALFNSLRAGSIPKHVSLLMDSHKSSESDFRAVNEHTLMDIALICSELGIKVLSVCTHYEKLTEGPADFTLNILKLNELSSNDIRVSVIGNRDVIPNSQLKLVTKIEETTKNNKTLHVIEAVEYNGRLDMVQACKVLAEKVYNGVIEPEEIDENVFQQQLETKCTDFPDPDLMIRTGGKYNADNFMLWQLAYSEICFVEKDGVQFNKMDFIEALDVYQKRNRRFGGSK